MFQGFYRRADLTRHLRQHEGLPSRERNPGDKLKKFRYPFYVDKNRNKHTML